MYHVDAAFRSQSRSEVDSCRKSLLRFDDVVLSVHVCTRLFLPWITAHHLNHQWASVRSLTCTNKASRTVMATDSKKRKNVAVTVDGALYNKRQRPDHFSTNGHLSNPHNDVDDRATARATQHSNNKTPGGPRGILPVLDDYDEEDRVDDDETYEAMRYLTGVRG
ncbi:hypothetical protein BJ546DRAFT_355110 [Cryomyces antarcticus]